MRSKKGYILTEILTGLYLQAAIILTMAAALSWLLSFQIKSVEILTARSHDNNFFAYLEPRIKNCGLGLFKCVSADNENILKLAFDADGRYTAPNLEGFINSLVIFENLTDYGLKETARENEHGIICGHVLGILYTMPLQNVLIQTRWGLEDKINPGNSFEYLLYTTKQLEDFSGVSMDIRSWCVLPTVGVPFLALQTKNKNKKDVLRITLAKNFGRSLKIPPVSEVFEVRAEFFYVTQSENGVADENFSSTLRRISPRFDTAHQHYLMNNPMEDGILETYFELDKKSKTLDVYILSYAGDYVSFNTSQKNSKPKSWPDNANWNDEYLRYELFVNMKSFKLDNVIF